MFVDIYDTDKKYSIIYADPPWSYRTHTNQAKYGTVDSHYQTMTPEQLKALPVKEIANKDSVIFLWVTYPCLEEGLELMKKWGFKYKTCAFNWVKLNKKSLTPFVGLGHYTRANAEICLLGAKGKTLPRYSKKVRQIIQSPIREHSRKPDEARERIVELFGDLPRIELFSRQQFPGWDCWGNEVQKFEDAI